MGAFTLLSEQKAQQKQLLGYFPRSKTGPRRKPSSKAKEVEVLKRGSGAPQLISHYRLALQRGIVKRWEYNSAIKKAFNSPCMRKWNKSGME